MANQRFADIHCHPNLKTYGHSFGKDGDPRQNLWYTEKPGVLKKLLKVASGITRFSQTDLSTMSKGGVKLAFVSLYPFEKGFFINAAGDGVFSAAVSNMITGVGYQRIRHLQSHTNYFEDLCNEYEFFISGTKQYDAGEQLEEWGPASDWEEAEELLRSDKIAAVLTIEGAHVFNSGLSKYGRPLDEEEILGNVQAVKNWDYAPVFITFAHNFNNDFCGHAKSLDPLEPFVDQSENLDAGFTPLGEKVAAKLLENSTGCRIYLDLKHMSITSRKFYYDFLDTTFPESSIPIVVSHGAVTGTNYAGESVVQNGKGLFYEADINFYDEEIVEIARSEGLFGIQLDSRRIASTTSLKKVSSNIFSPELVRQSSQIVWNQIRHIAEVLDRNELFSWGTTCIGSDFDGTINPLNGILTAEDFSGMAENLHTTAQRYLENPNNLTQQRNKEITPDEVVDRFCYSNAASFLKKFY